MTVTAPVADPIEGHVAALAKALRGPRRVRRGMLAEVRAGLDDAAEAHRADGMAPAEAEAAAVRDFGPVAPVARELQDELAAQQGRQSAILLVLIFPAMVVAWDLLNTSGVLGSHGPPHPAVLRLARFEDLAAGLVCGLGYILLAVTSRRATEPRRIARAIGVIGAAGGLTCAAIPVAMNMVAGHGTIDEVATNAVAAAAIFGSAAIALLIVWRSVRTIRVAARRRAGH
jgi:nitrate/nitrite transporter NarK